MGACIGKLGSSDKGKILFCLPLSLAELLWGAVFLTMAGLQCSTVIEYIKVNKDLQSGFSFWLGTIFSFISFFLVLATGIGCVLAAFLKKWTELGWLKSLTVIQFFSVILNFVFYIYDNVQNHFCGDCVGLNNHQLTIFAINMTFYVLVMMFFYFMMETHKSIRSVRRVGGTGWEGKSAGMLTGGALTQRKDSEL